MGGGSGIQRRTCPWSYTSLCGQIDIEGAFAINNPCHSREHLAHFWSSKTKESMKFQEALTNYGSSLWGRLTKAQQTSECNDGEKK
jgi:hypothetical protein